MKPRFQADEDFNRKIVRGLRRREPGIDCQDAQQGELLGLPDPEVLRKAADANRILLSHDRGTMPAHLRRFLQTRSSPGVIIVAQDSDIGAAIDDLLLIWSASDADEWRDQAHYVPF